MKSRQAAQSNRVTDDACSTCSTMPSASANTSRAATTRALSKGFSIRSVKLRHQRGALYTVPFGVLGAVQNQVATRPSTN
jgi:hypothetical protein